MPDGAFVVPDPNLIFNGEFKRAGLDLVLSHEGHEFVVHDYFRGEKRAALASPDGAHLTGDIVNALTGYVQVAQAAPGGAAAAQVIGHVTKLAGSATAIRNGVSVILNNGDNVEKGDVVSTGSDSTLGITFIDGTVFGLSSNARMVLNEMVYDPNGSSNSSLLSLVAGTITFVAGETAKHGDMKIDTPVATMGIRGTAVLTQINFVVPAGGGDPQPQASFQVLVEPNGTTGSYILFDKVTLLPIATVNQAGQMIQISGGNVSISNALMSPDVQKLITDVFTLKFTDNNTNTKLTTNFTDTLTPMSQDVVFKSASGAVVTATFVNLNTQGSETPSTPPPAATRIPGQPIVQSFDASGKVTSAFALTERADVTGDTHSDTISGLIRFLDQNLGDRPTTSISLADAPNYVYKDAGQHDVTSSLSALQKQDIAATQIQINVAPDAGNTNNGSAVWTYTIPDKVFDFLAAGETLTLTYIVRVDTNFAVSPESKFIPITITITGTNDKPTVATSGGIVIEKIGTGNEALDTITGTVTFTDVDLTDRPIVSAALSSTQPFKYLDAEGNDVTSTLTPQQLAAIAAVEVPLTVVQGAGNSNNGSATWTYSVPDHLFDFLAKGEKLTLNYVVQVDDGHGGVVSTPVTVSINGADVNVEGTNDVPTIVADDTTPAGGVTEDTGATLAANGTITFNDPDLTDTHTASFSLKSTASSAHLPGFSDGISHIGTFALAPVVESPGASSRGSVGWTFTLSDNDPVLQSLAKGQTITQVYTVTVDDHHGGTVTQDVTVTITGTNDAPTITSDADAAAGTVTEDAATPTLTAGGTLAIQDLDLIDTHTAQAAFKSATSTAHLPGFDGSTPLGTFSIDPSVTEANDDTSNGATLGWHFALNDNEPVLQSLAKGQTITQVYTVTFTDNNGAQVSQDVTVTITGTNDTPTITSDADAAAGGVTEDAATPTLSTGGTLAIQDLDLIDTHTAQAAFKSATSTAHLPGFDGSTPLGTFTIDPSVTEANDDTSNGATLGWHFALNDNDPVLQSLAEGQTITQVYTVTFTDNNGAQVSQDVTVTITGTNDSPTITSDADAAAGSVTEDSSTPTLTAGGTLAIQDLDLIDTHTAQAAFKSATSTAHLPGFDGSTPLGTFSIDPSVTEANDDTSNGATLGWHFVLNDNDPVLQSLAEGQTITQVYTVTFTDNNGAQVSQDVTVTITGTNDAPTITSDADAASGSVTEDASATLSISGTLAIQDLDLIDTHTAQAAFKSATSTAHLPGFDGSTPLGTFTIDPSVTEANDDTSNGATLGWHFALNDNDPVLQSLAEGQAITQVYTVTFTDNNGAQVSQDVTVTITGTNDSPTITSDADAAAGTVTEDASATLSISGTLAIQDRDLIDTHTAEGALKTSTSTAHLPGFDNDTPLGTFTIDTSVAEFNNDADSGATLGWHFSLDNGNATLQSLAQGQTITQVYTVTFTDDHGAQIAQDVTVTINGANDAPTVTSDADAAKGTVNEDDSGSLATGGTLAIQDVDLTDTHTAEWSFKSSSVSTDLPGFGANSHIGTFSIDSVSESATDTDNGATLGWHFTLDNSDPVLQSLAEGQTITQVYTVTFDDPHGGKVSQDVTVTITGTNDAPAVSYVTADYMNFDGQTIAVGEVPTVATDGVTLDGWVNWNGSAAPDGQVLFYNGNTSSAGFGLIGTVVNGSLEIEILEGGVDIQDTGFALTAGQWHNLALTRDQGTFTLYVDGNAVYSHSGGANSIGSGQDPSYMMIGGASDRYAPGFGAQGFTGSIADVSVWTTALTQVQIQSIDFTALTGNETNLAGYYQLSDGSGTTASNAVNSAKSLVIEGDADWASGTSGPGGALADLMETDAGHVTRGVLAVSDVDAIDHVTVSVSELQVTLDGVAQADSVGGLSHTDLLNYLSVPSGDILDGTATHTQFTWTFNSQGQAFDFLGAGQTLSLQYTIVPADAAGAGAGAVVTVNIAGTNDAPTLADLHIGPLTDTAAADTFSDLTGTLSGHDADTGETATLTYAVLNADQHAATTVAGHYGSLTVDNHGNYSYIANAEAINALPDGLYTDTFTVQTTDAHGATASATLTVDVTGANDDSGPVIDTTRFHVEHIIENSNDIVTDLVVIDTDAGAAADTFTVTLSTAHPDVSTVSIYPTTGSLEQINAALGDGAGITYDPIGASTDEYPQPPATDRITLTVADSAGHYDTVNFIFVEGADSPDMTLQGTSGKDVIFATESSDELTGGGAKDQFVFAPTSSQDTVQHTVNDFETGLDKIDLRQFTSITSWTQISQLAEQQGTDTLLTLDSSDKILLKNTVAGNLHASDFILHVS
ncbi:VCBS domain-containing protein [Bradyrhizobium japonicum]|nr:VCBS domain-containing protein [Bradyrhizobium japonicum]MBR0989379.1 VCBS domain-containing protein [Bradyrhizobium japonicum]